MEYQGFIDAVKNLNEHSYFFGNQVLYELAEKTSLNTIEELSGMIWLVGRSYAASPQRRSYGTNKETNWPVKSSNDGRDQFFSFIAKYLQPVKPFSDATFSYDRTEEDKALLRKSIQYVLQFNLKLSEAIEKFDYADKVGQYCTNHISFCSKFLHFYYPHSVFIIDTYAQSGAGYLFGKYTVNKFAYICDPMQEDTYAPLFVETNPAAFAFKKEVYDAFARLEANKMITEIGEDPEMQKTLSSYKDRNPENAQSYLSHCVHSYLLGCLLRSAKVVPSAKLAGEAYCSMPRLVDTVFLNIKGNLPKAELEKHIELAEKHGNRCQVYKEQGELAKKSKAARYK